MTGYKEDNKYIHRTFLLIENGKEIVRYDINNINGSDNIELQVIKFLDRCSIVKNIIDSEKLFNLLSIRYSNPISIGYKFIKNPKSFRGLNRDLK